MTDTSKLRETPETDALIAVLDPKQVLVALKCHAEKLERQRDELAEALRQSVVAIDDWLNTYAERFCDPKRVKEAYQRIGEFGTIGYIADVQKKNRAALAKMEGGKK